MAWRILILGTGSIAERHAINFAAIADCALVAAVDNNEGRVTAYAERHSIPHRFTSLEAALAWGEFDAAVNATPDPVHYPTTMQMLAAGKHVFCEKPLAVNHIDATAMAEAAEKAGLINMVNLTYRNAFAIQKAREMVSSGAIGALRHVEASYRQSWLAAKYWGDWREEERWLWRLSTAHGSTGVLGDVGVHIVDFATFGAGLDIAALQGRLHTFDKAPGGAIGPYRLDANDSAAMTVEFTNGALGVIHMSRYATGHRNDLFLTLHGDQGALRIWADADASKLEACLGADIETQAWRLIDCPPTPRNAERFAAALRAGVNGTPDFRRAATVQQVLDRCIESDAEGRWLRLG